MASTDAVTDAHGNAQSFTTHERAAWRDGDAAVLRDGQAVIIGRGELRTASGAQLHSLIVRTPDGRDWSVWWDRYTSAFKVTEVR
jgi:hypothetical protein